MPDPLHCIENRMHNRYDFYTKCDSQITKYQHLKPYPFPFTFYNQSPVFCGKSAAGRVFDENMLWSVELGAYPY